MKKAVFFSIQIIFITVVFSFISSYSSAAEPPETVIIAGPSGTLGSGDFVFWWTGKIMSVDTAGRLPHIKGFYYRLDNEPWSWTQDRMVAYYDIPDGSHRLDVRAVDSNNLEDPSPASRTFSIWRSVITEPDEVKVLFSVADTFQSDLNNGIISEDLRQEFLSKNILLSDSATVAGAGSDRWLIKDSNKAYIVKKDGGSLNFYGPVNDSSEFALPISVGKTVQCSSHTTNDTPDEDWFRVRVDKETPVSPTPKQIAIIFKRPDSAVSSTIKIFRSPAVSQGKEIGSFEVSHRGFFATGVLPGDYLIQVKPAQKTGTASPYFLNVTTDGLASQIVWDRENNNDSTSATETSPVFISRLTPWMEIVGNRWSDADNKDWFKVHATVDQPLRMSLNLARPVVGSITVRLYSLSPKILLGEFTVTPNSSPQWKLDTGVTLGDYLVEVDLSNYGLVESGSGGASYFLTLQVSNFPSGETWELEPNNSPDFASALPISTKVRATRSHAGDVDWFRLVIPHDGILSLTASRILKGGSVNVALLDSVGQPLSSLELSTGNQNDVLNTDIKAGNYFVRADFSEFIGDYWLTAMLITSVQHDAPEDIALTKGDKLSVTMVWERGNSAEFDVLYDNAEKLLNKKPVPMYDQGNGVYTGTYIISEGDNTTDGIVIIRIKDKAGNSSYIPVEGTPIIIDTTPPVIAQVSHDAQKPLSVGDQLIVTIKGEAGNIAKFDVSAPDGMNIAESTAYDDGKHDDGSADDGVYVGSYTVRAEDYVSEALVTGYLTDPAGNTASLISVIKVDIVGDRPVIYSIEHDGRLTLGEGEVLNVTLTGDPQGIASFDIEGLASNIPMYDDGQHNDGERGDGQYAGSYTVKKGDGVLSASVIAHLTDRKGKTSSKIAFLKVTIDAVAPAPVLGLDAYDRPNDQGGFISLTWKASSEIDFSYYNIYLSKEVPIPDGVSMAQWLNDSVDVKVHKFTDRDKTSADIELDVSKIEPSPRYFTAITAVDIMGNESLLDSAGGSTAGPVQAKDNLKPTPVRIVSAIDRAQDFGGVIIINWTEANRDTDFARYNIYQDTKPILSTTGLEPIDTIFDRYVTVADIPVRANMVDYYFAVTSVDLSDNESDIGADSIAGPVQAEINIEPEPPALIKFLSAPVGAVHYNHVAFHWNRFEPSVPQVSTPADGIRGYYIRLDDGNWRWTTASTAIYYDLSAGDHTFYVRPPESLDDTASVISRSFTVAPVTTSEIDPNSSQDTAQEVRQGLVIRGDSSVDDDWFKFHVPAMAGVPAGVPLVMDVLISRTGVVGSAFPVSIYSARPFKEIARSDSSPAYFGLGVASESDYLIHISSSGNPAPYRLVVNVSPVPSGFVWESEDNDSQLNADDLPSGEVPSAVEVRGISGENSDWFKVHIPESSSPTWMNLSFYSPDVKASNSIQIYSSSASVENRQIGEFIADSATNGVGYFSGVVTPGSDYYISIDGGATITPYYFLLSLAKMPSEPLTAWEVEPNNLPVLANAMSIGTKQIGTSWDGSRDDDYYKLNIKSEGILCLNFSRPSGAGSSLIEIYNPASQILGSFQADATTAQSASINVKVKAGMHYVKIHPQDEVSTAEYSLIALFVKSIKVRLFASDGGEIELGRKPLKAGDQIVLEMIWQVENGEASFSILDATGIKREAIPMTAQGDGLYKGTYTIADGDNMTSPTITVHLKDPSSNTADIELADIDIGVVDTTPPVIFEVTHDARTPLSAGKRLTVRMIGTPRSIAKFDITGFKTGLDMYNMTPKEADPPVVILNWNWKVDPAFGAVVVTGEVKNISNSLKSNVKVNIALYSSDNSLIAEDFAFTSPVDVPAGVVASFKKIIAYTGEEKSAKLQLVYGSDEAVAGESADEGVYIGTYVVGYDDNVSDAPVVCYLTDSAGNRSSMSAKDKVTFDNVPPIINSLTHDADKILVEGDVLTVTLEGEPGSEASFDIGDFRTGIVMRETDGKYVGRYSVRSGDKAVGALVRGHLKDSAGNSTDYIAVKAVNINTSAPMISSVTHNAASKPFIEGEVFIVRVESEPGFNATFDVENFIYNKPLFDDGRHDDGEADDGVYVGSYTIRKAENVRNGKVKVTVMSPNGKSVQRYALETMSVDTEPPSAITGVRAVDKPDDEGGLIVLSWSPSADKDFKQYRIYRSEQYITSTIGLEPIDDTITDISTVTIEIVVPVPVPDIPSPMYYFAVTAVDVAGNESRLVTGATAGPVTSKDNLPPPPVAKVTAYDRAYDSGKVIVVTWSEPSPAVDFHNYNIYMSQTPIDIGSAPSSLTLVDSSITDRNIRIASVTVPQDDVNFFFAVTAVDASGNESDIGADSVTGPVFSEDNLGAPPDTIARIISGAVGEIHRNDVTFRWRRWFRDSDLISPLPGYYCKLDDGNWVWTNDTGVTYYDLREGQHTFYVRADLGAVSVDPAPAVRLFAVRRIAVPETEPNNSGERANWISKDMTVMGANESDDDDDWYRFHVEPPSTPSAPLLLTLHFDRQRGEGTTNVTIYRSLPPIQSAIIGAITLEAYGGRASSRASFSTGVELGDYFVLVDSQGENPQSRYEMAVTIDEITPAQDGYEVRWDRESNDVPASAQLIGRYDLSAVVDSVPVVEVSGFGNKDADVDWYRLQVSGLKPSASAFMKVDFVRPKGAGLTDVSIYPSFPVSESSKVGSITYSPGSLPVQTISVPVTSGDYYFKVDNSQETILSSVYSFRISFAPATERWELEPNNVSQFANPLDIGKSVKGTSWHPDDDLDWYKVRLDRRGTLVLSFFRPFGRGATEIKLKGANLDDIAVATADTLSGQSATASARLNLGDYFIALDPIGEEDSSAEYQLVAVVLSAEYSVIDDGVEYPAKDVRRPASTGDVIKLTASWEPGNAVSFDIGDLRTDLPLFDDGRHDDSSAGDGIYAGTYTVQSGDELSDGVISLHLDMPPASADGTGGNSWKADFSLEDKLNIDTTPPKIFSVDHDMPVKPLTAGESLNVVMKGEAGAEEAFFHVQRTDAGAYGNTPTQYSKILMSEDPEGVYSGSLTVREGDDLTGEVVCHLIDIAGNESTKTALRPVIIDTKPPEIIRIEHSVEKTLVIGDFMIVKAFSDTKRGKATFSIGNLGGEDEPSAFLMYDDGSHDDETPDDGVYTGRYTVRKGDNITDAFITVRLTDSAGNTSESISYEPVSIDTTPPEIVSFYHDAKASLSEKDVLTVTLEGDPGNTATFDIGNFKIGLPMYDDGTRSEDDIPGDGIYIGTYTVKKNDLAKDARITGYLTDRNGNKAVSSIFERVDIDAVSPEPVTDVIAVDKSLDQGFWIVLSWQAPASDRLNDFDHYNIYRESAPIISLLGLTPLADSGNMGLEQQYTDGIETGVPTNGVDYYFAVTVVDTAGNESPLDLSETGSVFGPVQALDNIPPEPVTVVSAVDKPADQGKAIIVSWTKPGRAEDFSHYGIYLSREPITDLQDIDPIVTVTPKDLIDISLEFGSPSAEPDLQRIGVYVNVPDNDVGYYFAVTAFDKSGNESSLDDGGRSVAGPVRATDDTPPEPVILIDVVDTPSDDGGFIDVLWTPVRDDVIQYYNLYMSVEMIDSESIKAFKPVAKFKDAGAGEEVLLYRLEVQDEAVYVAVTAVDYGNNESPLDKSGRSVIGAVRAVSNIASANADTTIYAGFDPNTSVYIPAGAIRDKETVDILWPSESIIRKINEADQFLEKSHIDPEIDLNFVDTIRHIKSSASKLVKPVYITLSYPDVSVMQDYLGSGRVALLSQSDERKFRIFKLNELSRIPRWELVSGYQKVDIGQNTVSVQADSFGVFRVGCLKLPENLDRVVVYPNPFIPSQSLSGYITFKNLTENATIEIYNIQGENVRTLEKVGGGDEVKWNARNSKDQEVASGTYIFVIQNELENYVGKLVILR